MTGRVEPPRSQAIDDSADVERSRSQASDGDPSLPQWDPRSPWWVRRRTQVWAIGGMAVLGAALAVARWLWSSG